jgi:glyoxylase-like metal-dependent hydrolase (beta-lactamase superfamily II)
MSPDIVAFFDATTSTYSYVVSDPSSKRCAIIDPVLDYDPAAGRISLDNAARLIAHVQEQGLTLDWLLETHVHADHLSAATHLKHRLGGRLAIGERVTLVQETFAKLFNTGSEFATDGRQFDRLFRDGDSFSIGAIAARALHTPGHTQACMTYLIGDAAFVGDTLFMPDYGTARCDFPGGDARSLYRSIRRLFELPGETRL